MSEAFEGRAGGMAAYQELAEALEERYFAILRVEPEADQALVLQSVDNPEHMGKTLSWTAHLERYGAFLAEPAREKTMRRLSARALLESCRRGEKGISLSLDYVRGGRTNWVTIVTRNRVQKDGRFRCFVFVRQTNEEHLRQRIIDLYVYNTCDFFICLDARNNSYVMFSGSSNGTPLPPQICNDYNTETVKYANLYVPPEDREMVIREMRLERVIEMLESKGSHSLYTGVIDPVRGYTRKKLEYQYYNRERKKILLWRTDISQFYHEEMERNTKLREALIRAQTDSMTGLLNKQAFEERVGDALQTNKSLAAFLFVDLDNFKSVNDQLGHNTGDRVILALASILRKETADRQAIAGRIGGDEFGVFLSKLDNREEACQLARAICEDFAAQGSRICSSVSCSIGIAFYPDEATAYADLVEKADSRTYSVKASGKNGYASS